MSDYDDDDNDSSEKDTLHVVETRSESRNKNTKNLRVNVDEEVWNEPLHQGTVLQTPDLVLDIPPGALADSPTVPLHRLSRLSRTLSAESMKSSSSESSVSV